RHARREIAAVSREMTEATPFPGTDRWVPRLGKLAERLSQAEGARPGRYGWFAEAIKGFERRTRDDALAQLGGWDTRFALEEKRLRREKGAKAISREKIKGLIGPLAREP